MAELTRHRFWLLSFVGSMLALLSIVQIAVRLHLTGLPSLVVAFLVIDVAVVNVSYVGMIVADTRLAAKAGAKFELVPLWFVYLATGMGPFISVWLDRKASKVLSRP